MKIQEGSRIGATGRIVVLFTVVLMFALMALLATNPYIEDAMNENLESIYSTSGWTTMDWLGYSQFALVMMVALNGVFALAFGFIGLYAGSMLKKPKKTKE